MLDIGPYGFGALAHHPHLPASNTRREQVVRLLIVCGADGQATTLSGKTPLMLLEEGRLGSPAPLHPTLFRSLLTGAQHS